MADNEPDLLLHAEVGQPAPGEQALTADHQVGAVGGEGSKEGLWAGRDVHILDHLAPRVEDAEVQPPCVQIDTGVESVLLLVGADHHGLPGVGGA